MKYFLCNRNVDISGSLQRSDGGYITFEGGMSVDRTVRFDSRMTTTKNVPIFVSNNC